MPRASAPKYKNNNEALQAIAASMKANAGQTNLWGYEAHKKQEMFHSSKKKVRLYIGGNRSGKTTGGVVEDLWYATGRHPFKEVPQGGVRGRVVGVDFLNGISKIILPEIKRWCPLSDLRGGSWELAYDKELRTLHFENQSFIEFMSYDQDLDKFAGTSRHFVHYDEEPPKDIYEECQARLIDTNGDAWLTMTPVEGMTWIFDDLYMKGRQTDSSIEVIEVDMTENPHLNPEVIKAYTEGLDEDTKNARVHGKFVQLGGLIYKEFSPERHTIKPGFVPPPGWMVGLSLDHGLNNPTAWLWHAVSPDGDVVTFHEHYVQGQVVSWHAQKVIEINASMKLNPEFFIGDPSIRNTDPITGTSIHQEYIKFGIPLILANNDVAAGINRVKQYLGTPGKKPRWHVTENCAQLIWEMQRYRWKTFANRKLNNSNNKQETAHKKDDHACDSLRYFIMSRPELVAAGENVLEAAKNTLNHPEARREDQYVAQPWATKRDQFVDDRPDTMWLGDEMMGADW